MKIILVDDHLILAQALREALLRKNPSAEIGIFSSGADFFSDNTIGKADIILLDISIPDMSGYLILPEYLARYPQGGRIIVLSASADSPAVKQMMQLGAWSYLTKDVSVEEIWRAIDTVINGKKYYPDNIKDKLINSLFVDEQLNLQLSPKEKDILNSICKGLTIKEAAYELKLNKFTAQYYLRSLMKKLKVRKINDLIIFAIQNGLYSQARPK